MSKTKTFKVFFVIFIVLLGIGTTTYYLSNKLLSSTDYESSKQEVTTGKVTRQQTVEQLISKLQAEREQDPTFKAESERMERELETEIANMRKALAAHRKAQSRLDALTIVQVQYDVEIAQLEKDNQLK